MLKLRKVAAPIVIFLLVSLTMSMVVLGCGKSAEQGKKQYVKEAMIELKSLLLDVGLIDPAAYLDGFEQYVRGEFQDNQLLIDEIDETYTDYESIIDELSLISEEASEHDVLDDLRNLIAYVLLGADLMKSALDIVKRGAETRNNSAAQVILDMSNNYQNTYRMFFIEEYNRLADEYGLPEYGG